MYLEIGVWFEEKFCKKYVTGYEAYIKRVNYKYLPLAGIL
jgi:hypothetical protein